MSSWDPLGSRLIFLIGAPRSGTTLLQKVIGSHSEVHTLSEPWIAMHPLLALRPNVFAAFHNPEIARDGLMEFLSALPEGYDAYWEAVRAMLGHLYSRALTVSGKKVFLDKTPRYFHIFPELCSVFPSARFVVLVRNPIAVLTSVLESWVRSEQPHVLHPFGADLMLGPPSILEALRSSRGYLIRYEEVVAQPDRILPDLCSHLGLSYEDRMVDYGESQAGRTVWRHGDFHAVNRNVRPVTESIHRWRSVLAASPVWTNWAYGYLHTLGPELVSSLGYNFEELDSQIGPPPDVAVPWESAISHPS